MNSLKKELQNQIPKVQNEIKELLNEKGDKTISEVTVSQAYSGMRGIKAFVCDTSSVSPEKGLIIRGIPLLEITHILPEEVFFLLLTGRLPDDKEINDLKVYYCCQVLGEPIEPIAWKDDQIMVMQEGRLRKIDEG